MKLLALLAASALLAGCNPQDQGGTGTGTTGEGGYDTRDTAPRPAETNQGGTSTNLQPRTQSGGEQPVFPRQ